jgi:hypothetical protein
MFKVDPGRQSNLLWLKTMSGKSLLVTKRKFIPDTHRIDGDDE